MVQLEMALEDNNFISRIIREHKELEEKLIKLTEFKASDKFKELAPIHQADLMDQHFFMTGYLNVLGRRLNRLIKKDGSNG